MIAIAEHLRPFSHRPGTACLIPSTPIEVQVFPTLIRFHDRTLIKEHPLPATHPLAPFTVFQDLERQCVTIYAHHACYHITPTLEVLTQKKAPHYPHPNHERLSLGSHKSQDFDAIRKRGDLCEIFPLLYRLGKITPVTLPAGHHPMFSLLDSCETLIAKSAHDKIGEAFLRLFYAAFRGMLVPRLFDDEYQGIVHSEESTASPLPLLSGAAFLIRSLFIEEHTDHIAILPHLPPQFHAGRFVRLQVENLGEIDLEWSKKTLRRLVIRSAVDRELAFCFQPFLKTCRVQGNRMACDMAVAIKSGTTYVWDRFEK